MSSPAQSGTAELPAVGETFAFPLSFQQQRLWFLEQFEPGTSLYTIPTALRIRGALDADALARAVDEVVRRHEVLRTVFRLVGETPMQVIGPGALPRLERDDLSHLDGEAREAEVRRRVAAETVAPFDLEQGPPARFALARLAADDHLLLVTMHHIVSDGWSLSVFDRELWTLYEAFSKGEPSPLPEPELQYADAAVWQRERLQDVALQRELAWWRERLEGAPTALELPTDRPRPAVQSTAGTRLRGSVPAPLTSRLKELARHEDATLFIVLLAAFEVLLARYTGQDDVLVGTPIANRTVAEVEELIGFFANTLVLRTRLGGDPTFRELLARVRETVLDAHEHQDLPFEKLVEELAPERDLSRPPLFQVMFILQNAGGPAIRPAGLEVTGMADEGITAKFDLTVGVRERPDGSLRLGVEFASALFDRATAERMAEHYVALLESVAAHPGARIRDLPLMSGEERRRLLEEWNATARDFAPGLAHELFAARAAAAPDAPAVSAADGALTCRELDERSTRLARHLRGLGVAPGALVALCLERSAEMLVALLAVLKAGGAYLPLDPDYPAERLAYMLADSGAGVLVTQARLAERLPAAGLATVRVDADWPAVAALSAAPLEAGAAADDLAYVIYTSGSTGRPKGVQVRHGGVANFLHSLRQEPGMELGGVLVAVTTLSFDIAVLELFLPLVAGAATVVATREQAADPGLLVELLERAGATAMQATPATWRMLLDAGWTPPPSLRVLCGGEALPRELADRLLAGGAEVWNLYGPTETTIWSAAWRVEAEGPVVVGRPIANTRLYVLDPHGTPTPTGVPGELWIGGAGVARGYLGRPGLTAERFAPDPFAAAPGARMYRTGDRARWRADGTVELSGRLDTQVKLRGFRIELGEVESALREHAGVAEAAAMVREDVPGDARLVAYVVPAPGASAPAAELRTLLSSRLPGYMVPSAFVALEALPLTPNGKVDRRALPAPDAAAAEEPEAWVAPSTPTEEAVAAIWTAVLGLERVGANQSFFELGGHSLLATQVMARIRATLGASLPVRVLFEARTVAELARRVDEAKDAPAQGPRLRAAGRGAFRIRLAEPEPEPEPVGGGGGGE
ncbi:MAG: non-ribosomal peptide synthetase [Longimicrobiaceae bacterium]